MRRAFPVALAPARAPFPRAIPLFDRRAQPHPRALTRSDPGAQHFRVDDPPGHALEELGVRNRVETLRQVGVHDIGVALPDQPVSRLDRVARASFGPVSVPAVLEVRLEDRLQHQFGGGLRHPIAESGNAQRALPASRLRDYHAPHRRGPIRHRGEVLTQSLEPRLHSRPLATPRPHYSLISLGVNSNERYPGVTRGDASFLSTPPTSKSTPDRALIKLPECEPQDF